VQSLRQLLSKQKVYMFYIDQAPCIGMRWYLGDQDVWGISSGVWVGLPGGLRGGGGNETIGVGAPDGG
jgi:hypothetical protein